VVTAISKSQHVFIWTEGKSSTAKEPLPKGSFELWLVCLIIGHFVAKLGFGAFTKKICRNAPISFLVNKPTKCAMPNTYI